MTLIVLMSARIAYEQKETKIIRHGKNVRLLSLRSK